MGAIPQPNKGRYKGETMKQKVFSDEVFIVDCYAICGTREEAQEFLNKKNEI